MKNDLRKKIIKLCLSFGNEFACGYRNERLIGEYYSKDYWSYDVVTGWLSLTFNESIYHNSTTLSEQIPSLKTNNNKKLNLIYKKIKYYKKLWVELGPIANKEYREKRLKALKKEEELKHDF